MGLAKNYLIVDWERGKDTDGNGQTFYKFWCKDILTCVVSYVFGKYVKVCVIFSILHISIRCPNLVLLILIVEHVHNLFFIMSKVPKAKILHYILKVEIILGGLAQKSVLSENNCYSKVG